jgi:DNA ligase (NAD+)
VGEKVAQVLASEFRDLDQLMGASLGALTEISAVGPGIAEEVVGFFAEEENRKIIEQLRRAGLNFREPEVEPRGHRLQGEVVVITGTLKHWTRSQAEALVLAEGGRLSSSVSSRTTLLVAGEDAGSKLTKAEKLGVAVVSEEEFVRRVSNDAMDDGREQAPTD